LGRLELGLDGCTSRLQDGLTIDSKPEPGSSAGVDESGLRHAHEGEERPHVWLNEVQIGPRSARVVNAPGGNQERSLLVAEQADGCAVLVGEGVADSHNLVNPKL